MSLAGALADDRRPTTDDESSPMVDSRVSVADGWSLDISLLWVDDRADKHDDAGLGVADREEERAIDDEREAAVAGDHPKCAEFYSGYRSCFGSLLIHIHKRLMLYLADRNRLAAAHCA